MSLLDKLEKFKKSDSQEAKKTEKISEKKDLKPTNIDKLIEPKKDLLDKAIESKEEADLFGLRFWGWLAKSMHISGYSKMSLEQLKKSVGEKLLIKSKFSIKKI